MWQAGWREKLWASDEQNWDMVIIGGGITGAGVFLEAVRLGYSVLLIEQNDFASGTSSRSSKLVHGGLRYLAQYQFGLTQESVRERNRLLRDAPGLVQVQSFVTPMYTGDKPGYWAMRLGLWIYDFMAGFRSSKKFSLETLGQLVPGLRKAALKLGLGFRDARTDDARLVFRVLQQAMSEGRESPAAAANYVSMTGLITQNDRVSGVEAYDHCLQKKLTLNAKVVVNASGVWADQVCNVGETLRPLRGSHLIIPWHRLPIAQAVSRLHHQDPRTVFMYPWEGAVLLGTTDLDHSDSLDRAPQISDAEAKYLLSWANHIFPGRNLTLDDVISSYAGVRPVIAKGADVPSDESRESAIWQRPGMITVTGGKLTTFRLMASQVMARAQKELPTNRAAELISRPLFSNDEIFDGEQPIASLGSLMSKRLIGRYGQPVRQWVAQTPPELLQPIAGTEYLKAEIIWAVRDSAVVHLADLMLRRTRLGLLLNEGGAAQMTMIQELAAPILGWTESHWVDECDQYFAEWRQQHAPRPEQLAEAGSAL